MNRAFIVIILSLILINGLSQSAEVKIIKTKLPFLKDSITYADALNRIGILSYLENIDSSFLYAENGLRVSQKLDYKKGIADAVNCIGIVYAIKNDLYLSLKYFNEALKDYKQLKDSSNICQVLMNIGINLSNDQNQNEGIAYLNKAFSAGKKLQNDSIEALVIFNMLALDSTLSKTRYDSLMHAGKSIATKYKDRRTILLYDERQACDLSKISNNGAAEEILKSAAKAADASGLPHLKILFTIDLAKMLIVSSKDTAAMLYKEALNDAQTGGFINLQIQAASALYDYYIARQDVANSNKYAAILMQFYQNNLQDIRKEGITYLDFAIKEKELEEAALKEAANRKMILILLAASVLSLAMLLFTYRAYLAKRKHNKALEILNHSIKLNNELLETNNDFKNKLVSIIAHDFKQPLGDVQNLITIVRNYESYSREKLDEALDHIQFSSQSSLENFDNILEWIRKQLLGFTYQPQAIRLDILLDETIKNFSRQIALQNLTIQNNVKQDCLIKADREMIQFVNRNLIHNAIKFSKNNSTIIVDAKIDDAGELIVRVKDEGSGMNEEQIAMLFNFVNQRKYADNKEKGAGIALIICKDFIEKMHGRIWAKSTEDKGTSFFYRLPV